MHIYYTKRGKHTYYTKRGKHTKNPRKMYSI